MLLAILKAAASKYSPLPATPLDEPTGELEL